jgi:hypothetical protein
MLMRWWQIYPMRISTLRRYTGLGCLTRFRTVHRRRHRASEIDILLRVNAEEELNLEFPAAE